jgi:hypothetical protein
MLLLYQINLTVYLSDMKLKRINLDSDGNVVLSEIPEYQEDNFDEDGSPDDEQYWQKRLTAFDEQKEMIELTKFSYDQELWQNYQKLTIQQQKALTQIISGKTIRDSARECKVNEATVYRWLQQGNFYTCLKKWQEKLMFEADSRIKKVIFKALDKLEFVLDNHEKFEGKDYLKAIEVSLKFLQRGN